VIYTLRALYAARQESPGPVWYYIGKIGEWRNLFFYYWLIQGGDHNILVDTGVPFNKPVDFDILNKSHQYVDERCAHPADLVTGPPEALAKAGLTVDDIDTILITSMSSYATGNIEMFKNAEIYMSKLGWNNITQGDEMGIYDTRVFFPRETMTYLEGPGKARINLVGDEQELYPGLTLWWCGAHHRGSMGVSVMTTKGKVSFADFVFVFENIEEKRPIGALESLGEWNQAYDKLMNADIALPIHDERLFDRYPGGVIA
jgi:glyoxylase-like metal-dependent hydrolase (beta-lactamase superfamily II)